MLLFIAMQSPRVVLSLQLLCFGSWRNLEFTGPDWTLASLTSCVALDVLNWNNIVDAAGPGFHNTQVLPSLPGVRSHRFTRDILNLWIKRLRREELDLLKDYNMGSKPPDSHDPFPERGSVLKLNGLTGPLQDSKYTGVSPLHMSNGKTIYRHCKSIKQTEWMVNRTVWREKNNVGINVKPTWRVFYKAPLNKRSGDLQWRIPTVL